MPLPTPTVSSGRAGTPSQVGPVDADTLHDDLPNLAHDTAGTVDGIHATDQPCPGPDVHDAKVPDPTSQARS